MDIGRKPKGYYSDQNGITALFQPDWDSTFSYVVDDLVFYGGQEYRCIQAGKGKNPASEPTYWTSNTYSLPTASTSVLGGVKIDGTSITIAGDVISASGGSSSNNLGLINYITNATFEGNNTTGWVTYADAGAVPVDGTGGSPNETFTVNATTPLFGTYDAKLTKDAANRQGQGVSCNFTLDNGVLGQAIQINFTYKTGGSYADNDLGVYIYDVTGATVIVPSVVNVPASSTPSYFTAAFSPSANTSYRLIIHTQSANASAWTFEIDNIIIGTQQKIVAPAVSGWTSYAPVITNMGTCSNVNFVWSRSGNSLLVMGYFASGTMTGINQIGLPSGLTSSNTNTMVCGTVAQSATNPYSFICLIEPNKTYIEIGVTNGSNNQLSPVNMAAYAGSGVTVSVQFEVPIAQWSSNINLVTDYTEYASNSSSTDADDTTSFVYGSQGSPGIIGVRALTGTRKKRVQFTRSIQPTDLITFEVWDGWSWRTSSVNTSTTVLMTNWNYRTSNGGVSLLGVSSTQIDVLFYPTPDAGSGVWNDATLVGFKWRVRKTSNGNFAEQTLPANAVSNWNGYTPLIGAVTTAPGLGTYTLKSAWRRVGSSMEIYFIFNMTAAGTAGSGVYLVSLPAGYSMDTTNITLDDAATYKGSVVGYADVNYSNGYDTSIGSVLPYSPTQLLIHNQYTEGNSINGAFYWGSGALPLNVVQCVRFFASVPIAQWATNINLASDFTEYASNSSSTNGDDTTSFVNGSQGAAGIIGVTNLSASRKKRIQFTRAIQASDLLVVEYFDPVSGMWSATDVNKSGVGVLCNHYIYITGDGGVAFSQVDATHLDVYFMPKPDGSSQWGAAGFVGCKWRVRKTSNGNFAEGFQSSMGPTGAILPYAGTMAPTGYLLCDGRSYVKTDYPDLFTVIGTSFGSADATHFNVPDLRGQFLRGVDGGAAIDPDRASRTALKTGGNVGDAVGSMQLTATKRPNTAFSFPWAVSGGSVVSLYASNINNNAGNAATGYREISNGGDNESRPPNVGVNYIIKT
jgi:microcystin-dependent protein